MDAHPHVKSTCLWQKWLGLSLIHRRAALGRGGSAFQPVQVLDWFASLSSHCHSAELQLSLEKSLCHCPFPPAMPETLFVARPPLVHLDGPSTTLALTPVQRQAFPLLIHHLPFPSQGFVLFPLSSNRLRLDGQVYTIFCLPSTPFSRFSYSMTRILSMQAWSRAHPSGRCINPVFAPAAA